jgi:hypothetical protein
MGGLPRYGERIAQDLFPGKRKSEGEGSFGKRRLKMTIFF